MNKRGTNMAAMFVKTHYHYTESAEQNELNNDFIAAQRSLRTSAVKTQCR
jgi:hypothetical protein